MIEIESYYAVRCMERQREREAGKEKGVRVRLRAKSHRKI